MSVTVADAVLDANYNGPHADDAEYFAPGTDPVPGGGTPCRVMRGGEEAGLDIGGLVSRPRMDTPLIHARVGELALVSKGGHFLIEDTGEIFQIMGEPERLDRARREWTCQTVPVKPVPSGG